MADRRLPPRTRDASRPKRARIWYPLLGREPRARGAGSVGAPLHFEPARTRLEPQPPNSMAALIDRRRLLPLRLARGIQADIGKSVRNLRPRFPQESPSRSWPSHLHRALVLRLPHTRGIVWTGIGTTPTAGWGGSTNQPKIALPPITWGRLGDAWQTGSTPRKPTTCLNCCPSPQTSSRGSPHRIEG
jgi:hypothetical protein